MCYIITVKRGNGSTLRWEHIMALTKLIKNSIDTDKSYKELLNTALAVQEMALDALEGNDDYDAALVLHDSYKSLARLLQDRMWCEWGLWLSSHNCTEDMFHDAMVTVFTEAHEQREEQRAQLDEQRAF